MKSDGKMFYTDVRSKENVGDRIDTWIIALGI